jgi:hypothetical protein
LCSGILQYWLSLLCVLLQFVTRHFRYLSFVHIEPFHFSFTVMHFTHC